MSYGPGSENWKPATGNWSPARPRTARSAIASARSAFFFSSRRRHTRCLSDWSSDVCSSDIRGVPTQDDHVGAVGERSQDRLQRSHGVLADLHCSKNSVGTLQPVLASLPDRADVVVLCGDLSDYGLPEEARLLAKELASVRIPILAVLGNHDVEAGKGDEIAAVLREVGVDLLDGDAREIQGVGFVGVKGFAGGFGVHALGPWGEDIVKRFVHEAVDEALKLESALARLRTDRRVALLHYSPVRTTVEGEPLEILPFLGSSRLEEPLSRYPVSVVFHGHAHRGEL